MEKERYQLMLEGHLFAGKNAFALELFGDHIAKREGYKELQGMSAIYFYLVQKFHWPPAEVRGMSLEDIRFVLIEEMSAWTLPKAACDLEGL